MSESFVGFDRLERLDMLSRRYLRAKRYAKHIISQYPATKAGLAAAMADKRMGRVRLLLFAIGCEANR